jgi:CDP-glucose 4,6-dehydratase
MENVDMIEASWRGKSVFVTGHTGFKGAWLALLLARAGSRVHGFALAPPTDPNLFGVAGVAAGMASHTIADIRDRAALGQALATAAPEIVFHLAAQSLVRRSYAQPVETFEVNALGTVNLLEAARQCPTVRAILVVTSDKCYRNEGGERTHGESDALGGEDPYSASKACAELVTTAYRQSYFLEQRVALASVRAGNVIGGGDWAPERLLPDVLRASDAGQPAAIRHPQATRPWQHVLDPLTGYLALGQRLLQRPRDEALTQWAQAWNFGPAPEDSRPVAWLLEYLASRLPGFSWRQQEGQQPHEARHLRLDSGKARVLLGWLPRWPLTQALDRTVAWHQAWRRGEPMRDVCLAQIEAHERSGTEEAACVPARP